MIREVIPVSRASQACETVASDVQFLQSRILCCIDQCLLSREIFTEPRLACMTCGDGLMTISFIFP